MKIKATERVPYRFGSTERAALDHLRSLRSPRVPALGSDNQWLRFSVRLLAEVWELAGAQPISLRVGRNERTTEDLDLSEAPATEATSMSEARLSPGEAAVLDRLCRELGGLSRSATLRRALFVCRSICDAVSGGSQAWVARDGRHLALPGLFELSSFAEPVVRERIALLSSEAKHWPAEFRRSMCGDASIEYCSPAAMLEKLETGRYDCVAFDGALAGTSSHVRCVLQRGRPVRLEAVEAPSRLKVVAGGRHKRLGDDSGAPPEARNVRGPALALIEQARCVRS